jgi:hypothetical protein
MRTRILICSALALLWCTPSVSAQEAGEKQSKREEILAMIDLPKSAQALRKKGVDKREVKSALREAKRKKVKVKDTKNLLDASAKAVDENGPIDNFGAFVKSKLEQGLRGRELAAAIHAEHKARGKGRGKAKEKAKGGKDKAKERAGEKPEKAKEKGPEVEEEEETTKGKGRGKGKKEKE